MIQGWTLENNLNIRCKTNQLMSDENDDASKM